VLFWVHAAVAYLVYRMSLPISGRGDIDRGVMLALLAGALLPDLIDKPVSFVFSSAPSRSFAHSIFTTIFLIAVVVYISRRLGRSKGALAYILGHFSHLGADLVDSLFIPEETFVFLFWPLITDYHHIDTVQELLSLVTPTPYVLAQTGITVLAVALWLYDGKPGYDSLETASP